MLGAFFFAWSNKSRTRDAPTPTNISTKSEPLIEKNGTLASPATAFASKVLPVPGGPTNNMPLGIRAPSSMNFEESRRKSTISSSSSFSSSAPATSLNVTRVSPPCVILAVLLPNDMALPPPPDCRIINIQKKTNIPIVSRVGKNDTHQGNSSGAGVSSFNVPSSNCC